MRFSGLFITLALLSFGTLSGVVAQEQGPAGQGVVAKEYDDRYRIGFQDVIEVQVFRRPELTQRVNVNPNGVIFLPRLERPMLAACKTERELANDIATEYKSFLKDPFVTVSVVEQRSQSFGVIGAVAKPGSLFISRRIQLLELLSLAGGPTKEAGSRLVVARTGLSFACRPPGESEPDITFQTFRIRDIQEGKVSFWMRPGDIVSVLDSDVIYIYGSVKKPGEIKMKEPLTLRQAIASAEGLVGAASKDNIRVIRQTGDSGTWVETKYDLKEIDRGRINDPVLNPNDIVAVSEDSTRSIIQGITRSVLGGLGNLPLVLR